MNKSYITINNNKVQLPSGSYAEHNAETILFAGHVYHSIENREEGSREWRLNVNEDAHQKIINELERAECWLFPAIKTMGELIASAECEELEERTLQNAGHLISSLTEFLYSVQETKKLVKFSNEDSKELEE